MNIIACVKQVPDTEAQIKVKADGSGIEEGQIKWVMNPYDEYGVEEALKLKEKNGGDVTVVSLGPARSMETIRTALAMGADKGVHICDPAFDNADAFVVGNALAAVIKTLPHDIIFCGQRAIDDDAGQVGAMIAEALNLPQLTLVTKVDFAGTSVKVIRPIEGAQLLIETSLPCVITAQKGLNEPRYASLPNIMKARKKTIDNVKPADLGVDVTPRLKTLRVDEPPKRKAGAKVADAQTLADKLKNEAKVVQ